MNYDLEIFKQRVMDHGLEETLHIYYSIYRAYVLDNSDPEERGRILISCFPVGHDETIPLAEAWVDPAFDMVGPLMGWFNPPLVGSVVWVMFDNGDPGRPKAYFGGWFMLPTGKCPKPTELGYVDGKPQKRGFRSRAGHVLMFNDAPGSEAVTLLWRKIPPGSPALTDPDKVVSDPPKAGEKFAQLQFTEKGIIIVDANGTTVYINSTDKELTIQNAGGQIFSMVGKALTLSDGASPASVITMTGDGDIQFMASKNIVLNAPNINIEGGGIFCGKGAPFSATIWEMLQPWLLSHTHPTAAPGAPSPPTAPPPSTCKSQSFKVK